MKAGACGPRVITAGFKGRNAEGQTGIESALIVSRPTPVLELHGTALRCLVASKLSSGAVSAAGEAYTWGEGRCGKLGHGSADNMHAPTRVEALVGRADVCGMVQGDQHLLLLDQQGAVWACGENKEGQCGLGTPLEVIAAQHRRSFYDSLRPLAPGEGRPGPAHPPAASATQAGATKGGQRHGSEAGKEVLVAAAAAAARGAPEAGAWGSWPHLSRSAGDSSQASAALLSPGGVPLAAQLTASGLTPGCVHTPTRIGRDQHPLGEAHHAAALSPSGLRLVGASGLEQERVVGLAASRHFSVAVTAAGEVWTWGACYNGALGTHSSWSTSAQKVCGALAQAIGDAGGAIKAVAGGTFCAVLTANGK
ncbi:regulator of chromosome condensation 1/beta-lactamase-inhibitor protein II, partial [Haematococcus lacustris]